VNAAVQYVVEQRLTGGAWAITAKPVPDRDTALAKMHAIALASAAEYQPHGGMRLRVRAVTR